MGLSSLSGILQLRAVTTYTATGLVHLVLLFAHKTIAFLPACLVTIVVTGVLLALLTVILTWCRPGSKEAGA